MHIEDGVVVYTTNNFHRECIGSFFVLCVVVLCCVIGVGFATRVKRRSSQLFRFSFFHRHVSSDLPTLIRSKAYIPSSIPQVYWIYFPPPFKNSKCTNNVFQSFFLFCMSFVGEYDICFYHQLGGFSTRPSTNSFSHRQPKTRRLHTNLPPLEMNVTTLIHTRKTKCSNNAPVAFCLFRLCSSRLSSRRLHCPLPIVILASRYIGNRQWLEYCATLQHRWRGCMSTIVWKLLFHPFVFQSCFASLVVDEDTCETV